VILHEDVAALGDVANDLLPLGACDIDGDRLLVAVGAEIEGVVVVRLASRVFQVRRTEGAGIVAASGALDLDHLGAEIGQHLRRQGASKHAREVENLDAGKRQGRHGGSSKTLSENAGTPASFWGSRIYYFSAASTAPAA